MHTHSWINQGLADRLTKLRMMRRLHRFLTASCALLAIGGCGAGVSSPSTSDATASTSTATTATSSTSTARDGPIATGPPPPSTQAAAPVTIDCEHDGTGGGRFNPVDNGGAGGCEYSLNTTQWCGRVDSIEIVAPAGAFLVLAGDEGEGFGFFRWSDGTESTQQRVCP